MSIEVSDVFTPRRPDVNEKMYVLRPSLEKKLLRSISSGMHTILFGESGNGKSWLYKHVLASNDIPFIVANGGNASRLGSLAEEIYRSIKNSGNSIKNGATNRKNKTSTLFYENEDNDQSDDLLLADPLLKAFQYFEELYPNQKHIVVIDNLEFIFNEPKLISELADILILLDDHLYSFFHVTFLIVGLPLDIFEYFSKTKNIESVSNRIIELPKVQGLLKDQVKTIVNVGFITLLGLQISPQHLELITDEIFKNTMGIAQKVHEFCQILGYIILDNNNKFQISMLEEAEEEWLLNGLYQSYKVVESNLNNRHTQIARKNQVIFIIGWLTSHQFDALRIENEIKALFSKTVPATNMGIKDILTSLSKGANPLLRQNSKTNEFSLLDPRYAMCIRMTLVKRDDKITKRQFKRF